MVDNQRLLGQLEEGFRSAREDLTEIKSTLKEMGDRSRAFEATVERVEMHASALVDHEKRIADQEDLVKASVERQKTNTRWIKGIGALVIAAAGDHFGSPLAKWFVGLFSGAKS